MRREDALFPILGKVKTKKYLTIDIESKKENTQGKGFTRPFMIGVYDGAKYAEFRNEPHLALRPWRERHIEAGGCIDKAMNYILKKAYKGYRIYAHNGGDFDELFLLAWFKRHSDEYLFEVTPVQSSIQKITVELRSDPSTEKRKAKTRWTFLDSVKLFPSSLKEMLKTLGCGEKVEHDLELPEEDERWSVYLKQDVVGLYEALQRLHYLMEEELKGEIGMTSPATAMKLFRRKFLGQGETPSYIPRHQHFKGCAALAKRRYDPGDCEGCCHAFIRRAYYGGRTEVIRSFGENLRYYDINSSYVASMRELMPAGDRYIEERPKRIDRVRAEKYVGFVECDVEIPADCYIPPLPHRRMSDGKLIFPTGRFSGVWALEELNLLDHRLVQGRITKLKKIVWFRKRPVFREMVKELWQFRDPDREGYDKGMSALAKNMGNSTYGKFGMNADRTQIVFAQEFGIDFCFLCGGALNGGGREGICDACEGSKPATGDPEDEVWYQHRYMDAPYIIPQFAAYITALSRINLWKFAVQALDAGGRIYYMDTDSCITDVVLPSSKRLGEFKEEYPGILLDGLFVQPKVYQIWENDRSYAARMAMWNAKVQAWPSSGQPLMSIPPAPERLGEKVTMKGFPRDVRTAENLDRLRRGETLKFERLEKVRSLARRKFDDPPRMVEVKKSFKAQRSDKRVFLADGDTQPIWLEEYDAA